MPVCGCAFLEFTARAFQLALERRVSAEHHRDRAREHEGGFAVDVGERRIGREADGLAAGVTDVVAAEGALHTALAMTRCGPEANGDARQACDRLDDANQLRRTEAASEILEARREDADENRRDYVVG